jgi:hypothetical protein
MARSGMIPAYEVTKRDLFWSKNAALGGFYAIRSITEDTYAGTITFVLDGDVKPVTVSLGAIVTVK